MKTKSKLAAVLGSAALLSGVVLATALPANAAPGDGGTGEIVVHKFEQPESGDFGPSDGTELTPPAGASPIENVGFTVCSIDDIDLSDAADWDRLQNIEGFIDLNGDLVVTESGVAMTITCGTEELTDADGEAVFAVAADKAYFVYESTPLPESLYAMVPSLVTVPYPGDGTGAAWNYSVHIYPKNALIGSGATKNGSIIGSEVTFDITVPINNLGVDAGTGAQILYTQFLIEDQLSSALTYTSSSVTLSDSGGVDVPLASGIDYTLTEVGGLVTLTILSPNGLALLDANIGGELVLTIEADATATGDTSNTATITINGQGVEVEVPDPEEFFSGAFVMKEASNKGAAVNVPLAGAEFELYTKDGLTTCPDYADIALDPDLNQVNVGASFVSGANGETPELVLAEGAYCVYETVVPAGYKGELDGTLMTVAGEDSTVTIVNTQIGSDPDDLPSLPITGAAGKVLLGITGAALLAMAIGLFLVRRSREERAEQ